MGQAKAISRAGNLAVICQRCGSCGGHVSSKHPAKDWPSEGPQQGSEHGDRVLLQARLREDAAQWLLSGTMKIKGHQSRLHGLTYKRKPLCLSFPITLIIHLSPRAAGTGLCYLNTHGDLSSSEASCPHHTMPRIIKSPSGPFPQTSRRMAMPARPVKGILFRHRSLFMQESQLPAGEPEALDVLQMRHCPSAELLHLKCPSCMTALRAAGGGDRDVRGLHFILDRAWSDAEDETLSFPTKESCSKDHNHWAKPTLEM